MCFTIIYFILASFKYFKAYIFYFYNSMASGVLYIYLFLSFVRRLDI